jgi:hypothetical protein
VRYLPAPHNGGAVQARALQNGGAVQARGRLCSPLPPLAFLLPMRVVPHKGRGGLTAAAR